MRSRHQAFGGGIFFAVASIALSVAITAAGAVYFEGWSPADAAYFGVITLTTVGYGDLTPATPAGRAFVMCSSLLGLTVTGNAIGTFGEAIKGALCTVDDAPAPAATKSGGRRRAKAEGKES